MRVLDAFWPQGATWSGQVISSPPGPSGGPPRRNSCLVAESPGFTGLGAPSLPGFPVSPLPGQGINSQPWPRALTHCVAPLMRGRPGRRRPRARATGLSPVGPPWAGAEAALPRGWGVAQCATTALAGAVPRPCVRGARGRFGGLGPVPGIVSLPFSPSRPACPALRVAGRPVRVSLTLARWYAIPRGLCVPRARSGCISGSLRVPFACVCARAPAASAPPPLGGVACAPRAVPALGAGRAVPRGPCPSACPAPVPCSIWRARGEAVRSRFLPTWLCLNALWQLRAAGVVGGRLRGGAACHRCEGRLVSGAVPPPAACPPRRAAGVPRPVCPGCGQCGRGDPAPAPQRAPLRAGVARCGGRGRASPGGLPSTVARGV